MDFVRLLHERAHASFTPAVARHYAGCCMARGRPDIARARWRLVENAGEETPYREVVLATVSSVVYARKLIGELTADEYRTLGCHFLKEGRLSDAFEAFVKADARADILRVRRAAVKDGDIKLAERVARHLREPLTNVENADLLNNAIRRGASTDLSLIHRIKNAGEFREKLAQFFLEKRMRSGLQYPYLQMLAKGLGVGILSVQLEALFRRVTRAQSRQDEAIMIAEELARRKIHGWEERLSRLYRTARAYCIEYGSFHQADVYGRKCNMPLTLKELRMAATRFLVPANRRELWENKEWDWIHDRMAALIAQKVGAKKA